MRLRTLWEMLGGRDMAFTLQALRKMPAVHDVAWLASASKHGVLSLLADGPKTFEALCDSVVPDKSGQAAFRAWLRHGCLLKHLRHTGDSYALRGSQSRRFADPKHATMAAFVQGLVEVHHRGIYETMDRITSGDAPALADLNAPLVAAISEMLAPVVRETLDQILPAHGNVSMLEYGCGSGHMLRHACRRNPDLVGVGVELDSEVAARATVDLANEGLSDRLSIVAGDLRGTELDGEFDVVALFNLIYYFPTAVRGEVLATAARRVAPGGRLVLTSSCHGGTIGNNILDLWFSSIPQCGPLPLPDEIVRYCEDAGLQCASPRRIMPGEEYYRFVATRPTAP